MQKIGSVFICLFLGLSFTSCAACKKADRLTNAQKANTQNVWDVTSASDEQCANCVFCKIVKKESPCAIVYEDDMVLAFKNRSPRAHIHILIIPKRHITGLVSCVKADQEVLGHIQIVASEIANGVLELRDNGFRVFTNCGKNANQTVFHIHYHLVGGKYLGDAIN
jgi:histidine triad (HIT) family protein